MDIQGQLSTPPTVDMDDYLTLVESSFLISNSSPFIDHPTDILTDEGFISWARGEDPDLTTCLDEEQKLSTIYDLGDFQ